MEYCYAVPSDELKHYGVKGMHWGIRRYQPYSDGSHGTFLNKKQVKKTVRAMNRNSYTYSNAKYMRDKSLNRAIKYVNKAERADMKGRITKRNKAMDKAYRELDDAEFHKNTMNEAATTIENAIKTLDKGGYGVSSKEKTKMMVDKGKMMTNQILFGLVGQMVLNPRAKVTTYKAEEHPRFGVDNTGSLYPQNKTAIKLNKAVQNRGGDSITSINAKSNKGVVAAVTADQAKRMGLDNSTRITGKEESDMWKAIGRQLEKEQKKKRR